MKGWVGLVGWPIADGLPTWVVSGHPSAAGRAWDRESSPVKDQSSNHCATHPDILWFRRCSIYFGVQATQHRAVVAIRTYYQHVKKANTWEWTVAIGVSISAEFHFHTLPSSRQHLSSVWRIGGKIIRTALQCCVVYDSCAQWCAHRCEQFLHFCTLGLDCFCVFI